MQRVKRNEATAARRRMYFYCVDAADGMTPETAEAGGQPQISIDGAAWTNDGIGVLVAVGSGEYYAEVTQATLDAANRVILGRYKSADTAEARAIPLQVFDAGELDIDSTGSGLTLAKALEVLVAARLGIASYDAESGVWTLKGRDGETTVATVTLGSNGTRTASEIA